MNLPEVWEIAYALKKARAVLRSVKKGSPSTRKRMLKRVEGHIKTLVELRSTRKKANLLADRARRLNPLV